MILGYHKKKMKRNSYPGKFIVLEGLDGSGNTTQAGLLMENLKRVGKKVHLTKEPTGYLIGGLIRSWLAHDWKSSPECLQLLFTADRAHHLKKEIEPLLRKGIYVICDRYAFSTMAYGGLDIKDKMWLRDLNKHFLLPDLTFFVKVRPEVCMRRIHKSRFGIELFEKQKELGLVWKEYEKLIKQFEHIKLIDGEQGVEDIANTVFSVVRKNYFK